MKFYKQIFDLNFFEEEENMKFYKQIFDLNFFEEEEKENKLLKHLKDEVKALEDELKDLQQREHDIKIELGVLKDVIGDIEV